MTGPESNQGSKSAPDANDVFVEIVSKREVSDESVKDQAVKEGVSQVRAESKAELSAHRELRRGLLDDLAQRERELKENRVAALEAAEANPDEALLEKARNEQIEKAAKRLRDDMGPGYVKMVEEGPESMFETAEEIFGGAKHDEQANEEGSGGADSADSAEGTEASTETPAEVQIDAALAAEINAAQNAHEAPEASPSPVEPAPAEKAEVNEHAAYMSTTRYAHERSAEQQAADEENAKLLTRIGLLQAPVRKNLRAVAGDSLSKQWEVYERADQTRRKSVQVAAEKAGADQHEASWSVSLEAISKEQLEKAHHDIERERQESSDKRIRAELDAMSPESRRQVGDTLRLLHERYDKIEESLRDAEALADKYKKLVDSLESAVNRQPGQPRRPLRIHPTVPGHARPAEPAVGPEPMPEPTPPASPEAPVEPTKPKMKLDLDKSQEKILQSSAADASMSRDELERLIVESREAKDMGNLDEWRKKYSKEERRATGQAVSKLEGGNKRLRMIEITREHPGASRKADSPKPASKGRLKRLGNWLMSPIERALEPSSKRA